MTHDILKRVSGSDAMDKHLRRLLKRAEGERAQEDARVLLFNHQSGRCVLCEGPLHWERALLVQIPGGPSEEGVPQQLSKLVCSVSCASLYSYIVAEEKT